MTEQEKISLIEETLELDEGTLTADTVLADVDEYDSMAKLSLIVMMDDEFGAKLTGDMIKSFVTGCRHSQSNAVREEQAMTEQEKISLIEETLELDEGTLTADTVLADVDEYDSMAKLSLIVMMDDEFGVKLTGDMIKSFVTVADILKVMQ